MKKTNILKIAFTLVFAILIFGASAQTHPGTAIPGAAADQVSGAVDGTTYLTEGTTIPLFALPDDYFHPSWDLATADWTLTDGYYWDWDDPAATLTFSNDGAANFDNYTEVSAALGDAGAYPITVSEVGAAGCAGATTTITITVVTQPTFAINTGDATYADCELGAGLPGATDLQTTIAGGWENYHLAWNLEIATLDDASAKEFYYSDESGAGQNAVQFYAVDYTQANGSFDAQAASAAYDIVTVGSFDVINNTTRDAVTVYTYTLLTVNDRASRFGDFIALNGSNADASLFTDYAATAASDVVTVTVYPAPITGPIYHIIDTWSN
ncbi:hypothetical protein ACFLQ3_02310 [Bacteroidota bacterium]